MSNTRSAGKTSGDETHEAHGDGNPAPESGMSADTINIPDNVIQSGVAGYDQADQDDLLWLVGWARSELAGSRDRLCEKLEKDWTTIWRVLTGKYGASIESFMEGVRDLRRRVAESGDTGFVETIVSKRIFDLLDYALAGDVNGGRIVMICGKSRRGKTEAVREWCRRNNHGKSVYIDAPESGGLRALMYEVAERTGVNKGRKTADLRQRLIDSFNRRRILIVDEVIRMMPQRWGTRPVEFEFLRRLHDTKRCAIALVATDLVSHEMQDGQLKAYFEQMWGRVVQPLYLPPEVRRDEARDIVQHFNARASEDLVSTALKIAREHGKLGVLFEDLRIAAAFAKRRGQALSAEHLTIAHKRRDARFQWPEDKAS